MVVPMKVEDEMTMLLKRFKTLRKAAEVRYTFALSTGRALQNIGKETVPEQVVFNCDRSTTKRMNARSSKKTKSSRPEKGTEVNLQLLKYNWVKLDRITKSNSSSLLRYTTYEDERRNETRCRPLQGILRPLKSKTKILESCHELQKYRLYGSIHAIIKLIRLVVK